MSLIEAAGLGFSEEELINFAEKAWKKSAFERNYQTGIITINHGQWGYLQQKKQTDDLRSLKILREITFKGNLVWEMYQRGILGESFLAKFDFSKAKKAMNLLRQAPLYLRLNDLWKKEGATEVRINGFPEMLYLVAGGRGEIGDFGCDNYIVIELPENKSDTLLTGGIAGGIVF